MLNVVLNVDMIRQLWYDNELVACLVNLITVKIRISFLK